MTGAGRPHWPGAHGPAPVRGRVREEPEFFRVDEDLGFTPDGAGQHVLLHVEKRNTNTDWLAGQIARLAGVPRRDVGFAGLKDRNAVTTQWFSIDLRGAPDPDWSALESAEIRVLTAERHGRKLKRGALRGNRFTIRLTDLSGDLPALEERLETVRRHGVPNYFGEQRFGRDFGNIEKARALLEGRMGRVDRARRSIYLSAARSLLFNAVLAERVADRSWNKPLAGDVMVLRGRRARFLIESVDDEITGRCAAGEIAPSGPLWGRGEPLTRSDALALEERVLSDYEPWCRGLEKAGLEQDRRPLVVLPEELTWVFSGADAVELGFGLPAGAYATTLLRELVTEPA